MDESKLNQYTPFSTLVKTAQLERLPGLDMINDLLESDPLYSMVAHEDEERSLPWYFEELDYTMDAVLPSELILSQWEPFNFSQSLSSVLVELNKRNRVPKDIDKYILRKFKKEVPINNEIEVMLFKVDKLNRKLVKLAKKKAKLETKIVMQEAEEEELLEQLEAEQELKLKDIESYLESIMDSTLPGSSDTTGTDEQS